MSELGHEGELPFDVALRRGDEFNHARRFADCVQLLERHVSANPTHHWLNFHLGRAYSGLEQSAKALARFKVAANSAYPYRVGAFYECARLAIAEGRFDETSLLDEALALPGDIDKRDEAAGQKRFYYDKIHFLKALVDLRGGDLVAADRQLEVVYAFNRAIDERPFTYAWLIETLRRTEISPGLANLSYLKQRLLRLGMAPRLSYAKALDLMPRGSQALEIGGMDGVRFDSLHSYLKKGLFEALVVEPLPDMFALLSQNYKDTPNVRCANVAISEQTAPLSLFRISQDKIAEHKLADWIHGISSAVKTPVLAYHDNLVTEEIVRGLSFSDFAREFDLKTFDILQIDTEGFDWNILKQIDLKAFNVQVAQVEVINLMPRDRIQVFAFLEKSGYPFDYDYGEVVTVSPEFYAARLQSGR